MPDTSGLTNGPLGNSDAISPPISSDIVTQFPVRKGFSGFPLGSNSCPTENVNGQKPPVHGKGTGILVSAEEGQGHLEVRNISNDISEVDLKYLKNDVAIIKGKQTSVSNQSVVKDGDTGLKGTVVWKHGHRHSGNGVEVNKAKCLQVHTHIDKISEGQESVKDNIRVYVAEDDVKGHQGSNKGQKNLKEHKGLELSPTRLEQPTSKVNTDGLSKQATHIGHTVDQHWRPPCQVFTIHLWGVFYLGVYRFGVFGVSKLTTFV